MTDTIDAALGATTGLLAVGIMAGVASKMIGNRPNRPRRQKPIKHRSKTKWL